MVRSQRRWNILFLNVSARNTKLFEQIFSPLVFLIPLHTCHIRRNALLVPYDGEAHTWRERTHDSRIAAKTRTVRFRDLVCLRAGVDDDEQNQPDFEMTVEMWEVALGMSTKPPHFPEQGSPH